MNNSHINKTYVLYVGFFILHFYLTIMSKERLTVRIFRKVLFARTLTTYQNRTRKFITSGLVPEISAT